MKTLIAAAALGLTALTAVPALAQVNARQAEQQARINQGVRSGELTNREANHLERQQARINNTEQRMRAQNGGYLRPGQKARLEARQDRASANIYRKKHNARAY